MPLLLAAASAVAAPCTRGTWDLKAGDQPLFRLEIKSTPVGTTATWERPSHFRTDGESFSQVTGPAIRRPARSLDSTAGNLELSFDDPAPNATPDVLRVRCVASDHLDVTYQGMGFESFDFVRAPPKEPSLGPWDTRRSYVRAVPRRTNVEMTAIFDADQSDRRVANIDWSIVRPADEKRRIRTQELLNADALQSGDDFYHAAFVFQHGHVADDFLKAHLLAMIATARGAPGALWIVSATLDRYLQTTGKPQVLGTQYLTAKGMPPTQEPYDRTLVSDAMRKALHVPPLSEQEERQSASIATVSKRKAP